MNIGFRLGERVLLDNKTIVTIYSRKMGQRIYKVYANNDIHSQHWQIREHRLSPLNNRD